MAFDCSIGTTGTTRLSFYAMNGVGFRLDNASLTAVPEPSTAALMGLGLFGLAAPRRRRAAVLAAVVLTAGAASADTLAPSGLVLMPGSTASGGRLIAFGGKPDGCYHADSVLSDFDGVVYLDTSGADDVLRTCWATLDRAGHHLSGGPLFLINGAERGYCDTICQASLELGSETDLHVQAMVHFLVYTLYVHRDAGESVGVWDLDDLSGAALVEVPEPSGAIAWPAALLTVGALSRVRRRRLAVVAAAAVVLTAGAAGAGVLVVEVEDTSTVRVVRHEDSSATIYLGSVLSRGNPAALPARPAWPVGLSQLGQEREP